MIDQFLPGESGIRWPPPKAQPPRKRSGKRAGRDATRWKEAETGLAEGASLFFDLAQDEQV